MSTPTPPDKEPVRGTTYEDMREIALERREIAKQKFQFAWCTKCSLLKGCYYQHGEFKGPMFLEPACGEGPA